MTARRRRSFDLLLSCPPFIPLELIYDVNDVMKFEVQAISLGCCSCSPVLILTACVLVLDFSRRTVSKLSMLIY